MGTKTSLWVINGVNLAAQLHQYQPETLCSVKRIGISCSASSRLQRPRRTILSANWKCNYFKTSQLCNSRCMSCKVASKFKPIGLCALHAHRASSPKRCELAT
jgi:hypothetical protein